MSFGWAYVDCSGSGGGGQAAGPVGSIQFVTGTNATSGSSKLLYHTTSLGTYQPSTMVLSGNLIVTGAISASVFQYKNIQIIDATGSTSFGNTNDDTHTRIGSLIVKKAGASCKGSVSSLRAKAKKYGGEKGKMYHWCANMKGGKKK